MGNVLIRADGSPTLGMGHISRCLALAHALGEQGLQPVFVCKQFDPRVERRIAATAYALQLLDRTLSLHEDARALRLLAGSLDPSDVIIDISSTVVTSDQASYTDYLHTVSSGRRAIIVDDLTRVVFPSAVVVNPSVGAKPAEYDLSYRPVLLLGPRYALLHSAYRSAASGRPVQPARVGTVAVCLGGGCTSDSALLTVLRGVRDGLGTSVDVQVVTGLEIGGEAEVSAALRIFTGTCTVLTDVPHLADVFARADLAVVSGGVTKYEAAAAATPAIMVAMAEHQIGWARAFEQTGAAVYAGYAPELTPTAVSAICRRLNENAALRRRMAEQGSRAVDGWGARRVVEAAFSRRGRGDPDEPAIESSRVHTSTGE